MIVVNEGIYKGLKCISPEELYQLEDVIVIPMIGKFLSIEKQLIEHNLRYIIPNEICLEMIADMCQKRAWFAQNTIMEVFEMLEDNYSRKIYTDILCNRIAPQFSRQRYIDMMSEKKKEYFNPEVFFFNEAEFFLDCGAYNGDSLSSFLEYVNFNFSGVISFEMEESNFEKLQNCVLKFPSEVQSKIKCIHGAVWNENSELEYGKEMKGSNESFSLLKSDNRKKVKTLKIDDVISIDMPVSFIKMDIEGAELNALKGAEQVIKRCTPKLAICIYHRLNDFWEIPMYIKSIVPEYKLSIRHHGVNVPGTVLYAHI